MKTIQRPLLESDPNLYNEIAEILEDSGIVCFPSPSGYKLAADLTSPKAITAMYQAKRRIKTAPSLVLVPSEEWVVKVASEVSDTAERLMRRFWPGPLTLLFLANEDLHPKVRKPLTKAKGWLGIRLPGDDVARGILKAFDRPLLVSSANLAKKRGADSAAQVRKNFGRTVMLMVDAGDLKRGAGSTLVDMTGGRPSVIRAGAISEAAIQEALEVA